MTPLWWLQWLNGYNPFCDVSVVTAKSMILIACDCYFLKVNVAFLIIWYEANSWMEMSCYAIGICCILFYRGCCFSWVYRRKYEAGAAGLAGEWNKDRRTDGLEPGAQGQSVGHSDWHRQRSEKRKCKWLVGILLWLSGIMTVFQSGADPGILFGGEWHFVFHPLFCLAPPLHMDRCMLIFLKGKKR